MKLKEFEAKQLLQDVGIATSQGIVIRSPDEIPFFDKPRLLKVQTLAGGRGKAGGIKVVADAEEAKKVAQDFLGTNFLNEEITEIILDQKVEIKQELYLGILFDTSQKCPVLIFSEEGGVDIEQLKQRKPEKISIREIDYLQGITPSILQKIPLYLHKTVCQLYTCFIQFDCTMIEINPLVVTPDNQIFAVDAVTVLDDDAHFRRKISFPERTDNRKATAREIAAREIDKTDYRGVAGKTFLDLDGDIALLTSGGGASMTLMDALVELQGKPANFTEYSGNPPQEKVEKLARIVLAKKNLSGLLVAGVIANFTNIAETLQGVVTVLKEVKPDFPIVIRRAGPHDEEARKIVLQVKADYNLDLHYYDEKIPLTKAAEIMVDLSTRYKSKKC